MAVTEAIAFMKWVKDGNTNVPDAVSDIYAWAIANDEYLPEKDDKGNHPFGRYEDLTGQANVHQRILDNLAIFAAKLEITDATAAQFASDPRLWVLGFKRFDADGEVIASNWDTTLTAEERQQAVNFITSNSTITAQQLAARFDVDDTRREIAEKLKEFFRE